MKILIAGCGEVGETLVDLLSAEGYDLTLLDSDPHVLETGVEQYDIMAVQGNCASMDALKRAGVHKAKLLIACTGSDELNMLCCMTAHNLNPNLHTIARIRDPEYLDQVYRMRDAFGISMTFNPEQDAAAEIERLIKFPGFLTRESLLGGRVELAEFKIEAGSKLCNIPLMALNGIIRSKILVCAVLREGKAIIPDGHFILEEGDRLFVTAPADELSVMLKSLGKVPHRARRVMIAGGGTMAYYLAKQLKSSRSVEVEIIEPDAERCRELAELLPRATVVQGDIKNLSMLDKEGLGDVDAMVSLTDRDAFNVIISLYAHSRRVPQVITRLGQLDDSAFVEDLPLGSVISPGKFCCNTIVRYVRAIRNQNGAAVAIHTIAEGQAEAIEFEVDPDTHFCGTPLKEIKLQKNVRLACILRGNEVIIPGGDSCYEPGDTVLVLAGGDEVILKLNDIFA